MDQMTKIQGDQQAVLESKKEIHLCFLVSSTLFSHPLLGFLLEHTFHWLLWLESRQSSRDSIEINLYFIRIVLDAKYESDPILHDK